MSVRALLVGGALAARDFFFPLAPQRQAQYRRIEGPTKEQGLALPQLANVPPAASKLKSRVSLALAALLTRRYVAQAENRPVVSQKTMLEGMAARLEQALFSTVQDSKGASIEVLCLAIFEIRMLREEFEQSGSKTVDHLDEAMERRIQQISDLLDQFKKDSADPISEAARGIASPLNAISQVVNASPTTSKIFQMGFGKHKTAILNVEGTFPFVGQGREVSLQINGHTLSPLIRLSNQLTFLLSEEDVPPKNDQFQAIPATLAIGPAPRRWCNPLKLIDSTKPAEFGLCVVVLPKKTGTIRVEMTTTHIDDQPHRRSTTIAQFANRKEQHLIHANKDWEILPGSIRIEKLGGIEANIQITQEMPRISLVMTTGNRAKRSTHAKFRITYEEKPKKPSREERKSGVARELDWGSIEKISIPSNTTCRVFFTGFDGKEVELDPSHRSNPFVRLLKRRGELVILSEDPLQKPTDPANFPLARL